MLHSYSIQSVHLASCTKFEEEDHRSCLIHFVDRNILNDLYIANGALVEMDKVITTRDFLHSYSRDIKNEQLYAYPKDWQNNRDQIRKVIKIYIDLQGSSLLAVAIVSSFTPSYSMIYS